VPALWAISPIGGHLQITHQHSGGSISATDAKLLSRALYGMPLGGIRTAQRLSQGLQCQFDVNEAQVLILEVRGHWITRL
jgi:hypothetical protein